jgi:hypothetical protein
MNTAESTKDSCHVKGFLGPFSTPCDAFPLVSDSHGVSSLFVLQGTHSLATCHRLKYKELHFPQLEDKAQCGEEIYLMQLNFCNLSTLDTGTFL